MAIPKKSEHDYIVLVAIFGSPLVTELWGQGLGFGFFIFSLLGYVFLKLPRLSLSQFRNRPAAPAAKSPEPAQRPAVLEDA